MSATESLRGLRRRQFVPVDGADHAPGADPLDGVDDRQHGQDGILARRDGGDDAVEHRRWRERACGVVDEDDLDVSPHGGQPAATEPWRVDPPVTDEVAAVSGGLERIGESVSLAAAGATTTTWASGPANTPRNACRRIEWASRPANAFGNAAGRGAQARAGARRDDDDGSAGNREDAHALDFTCARRESVRGRRMPAARRPVASDAPAAGHADGAGARGRMPSAEPRRRRRGARPAPIA